MIAARLHKTPNPRLRKGSYLVPIGVWEAEGVSGAQSVRHWRSILRKTAPGRLRRINNVIRYITLVRIPDEFPVAVYFDWCASRWALQPFRPLRECLTEFPTLNESRRGEASKLRKSSLNDHGWCTPELVLGESLPESAILWTKDIRQLYGRKRKQPPGEGSKRSRE